jgi:hypothetical protein
MLQAGFCYRAVIFNPRVKFMWSQWRQAGGGVQGICVHATQVRVSCSSASFHAKTHDTRAQAAEHTSTQEEVYGTVLQEHWAEVGQKSPQILRVLLISEAVQATHSEGL